MARTIRARAATTCPLCMGVISRGAKICKSYRLQQWVHLHCLLKDNYSKEEPKD